MENHPIPQDVTGFKFKLIGSVTIKQFLYILGGGILAGVCFILPLSGFIKVPLAMLFGGIGTAVAFIPIEGRPMDVMLKNFLKALPSENQFIFKKRGAEALIFEFFTPQSQVSIKTEQAKTDADSELDSRRALLYKTLKQSYRPDEKEQAVLTNINTYLHESSHSASPTVQNIDAIPEEKETPPALQIVTPSVTIATKEVREVRPEIVAPVALPQSPAKQQLPDPQVLVSVAQKIQSLDVNEKSKLVSPQAPIQQIQQTASSTTETITPKPAPPVQAADDAVARVQQAPVVNPLTAAIPLQTTVPTAPLPAVTPDQTSNVTTVTPETSLKAGFPQLPDTPNIVLGIIKDPRGKVLPNVLVEIMNEQGVPVRAFKTNALGQFAAATPLPNGNYTVILEDPRKQHEFGQIQIELDGKIFNPLEIYSVDQREKLRRELFGSTPAPQVAGA